MVLDPTYNYKGSVLYKLRDPKRPKLKKSFLLSWPLMDHLPLLQCLTQQHNPRGPARSYLKKLIVKSDPHCGLNRSGLLWNVQWMVYQIGIEGGWVVCTWLSKLKKHNRILMHESKTGLWLKKKVQGSNIPVNRNLVSWGTKTIRQGLDGDSTVIQES